MEVLGIGALRVSPRHRHRLKVSAPMSDTQIAILICLHMLAHFRWESMAMNRTPMCLNNKKPRAYAQIQRVSPWTGAKT